MCCGKKISDEITSKQEAENLAQELANNTGEWHGVYIDGEGEWQVAQAPGPYPFRHVVSPQLSDNTV